MTHALTICVCAMALLLTSGCDDGMSDGSVAAESVGSFGLTTTPAFYVVDTGGGLVFKVRRSGATSTQSIGDIASLAYNGVDYQDPSRGSQINSGFGWLYKGISSVDVSATTVGADFVKITVQAGSLTHYYLARRGYPHVYMATYFTAEPDVDGLVRYIVRLPSKLLPNGPLPSDILGNTGVVEAHDIFAMPDGTTRSKHYSNQRIVDYRFTGATGNAAGVFMVRSNHEGGSGGPFYRSLINQGASDQEIYEIINYGEAQTETFRTGVLNGPYILVFTNGGNPPSTIDTAWVANMQLTGYVPPSGRGRVSGKALGISAGFPGWVGFAGANAQYWCAVYNGNYVSPPMIPGSYTETLYKGELEVASQSITVTAGDKATRRIASTEPTPTVLWRIGEWDGTPAGLLNADKVTTMHPSDPRMSHWGPVTFTVGSSATNVFPAYQWAAVNSPTTIQFELRSDEIAPRTVRVGITTAYAGGRPRITINSWTSPILPASTQPNSRTLTVGTYRGNNITYTFDVPASAFIAGTNTMTVAVVSGSAGDGFLSPGFGYDAIDIF